MPLTEPPRASSNFVQEKLAETFITGLLTCNFAFESRKELVHVMLSLLLLLAHVDYGSGGFIGRPFMRRLNHRPAAKERITLE